MCQNLDASKTWKFLVVRRIPRWGSEGPGTEAEAGTGAGKAEEFNKIIFG